MKINCIVCAPLNLVCTLLLFGMCAHGQVTNSPISNTNGLIVCYAFNEAAPPWSPISAVGDATILTNRNACTNSAPGLGVSGSAADRCMNSSLATVQGGSANNLGAQSLIHDTNLDNLTAFTLSGWYDATAPIVAANRLLSCLVTANGGFEVQGNPNGPGLSLQMWGGGTAQRSVTNAIFAETNRWVFWAVTWNVTNGAVNFYAGDSVTPVSAFGSSSFTTKVNTGTSTNLTVGNLYALSRGFWGYMDNVAIYSNALTLPQLEANREANLEYGVIVRSGGSAPLIWAGNAANNLWDVDASTNWVNGSQLDVFFDADNITFNDSGLASPAVDLVGPLYPGTMVVSNRVDNYVFAGTGGFSGMTELLKEGSGTLIISNSGANSATAPVIIGGGTLRVAGYTNRLSAQCPVTLSNTPGATLDINGLFETVGTLSGGGALGGGVTLGGGTLQISATGGNGNFGGVISGSGSVIMNGSGTAQIISGTNAYSGGTIISSGTLVVDNSNGYALGTNNVLVAGGALQFGNDDTNGFIAEPSGSLTNNGTVIFCLSNTYSPPANIIGSGSIAQGGSGVLTLTQGYAITNWIVYNSNGVMRASYPNVFPSGSAVTVAGGNAPLPGPGGQFEMDGGVTFASYPLTLGCRGLVVSNGWACPPSFVNHGGSNTWTGNIGITVGGNLVEIDSDGGYMNIAGNISTVSGSGRTLILGGSGNGVVSGIIQDGTGALNLGVNGTGIWSLAAANTYSGTTIISNGTLLVDGSILDGDVDVGPGTLGGVGQVNVNADNTTIFAGGTLAPGDPTSTGTLTFDGNLTVAGNYLFKLDKATVQSNDLAVVNGSLNNTGTGTLVLNNIGPALAVGDTFTLFSQPLVGGGTLTIAGPPGVTFANNLSANGSVSVLSVSAINQNPTNITVAVSGGMMTLSWPADHTGWQLLVQTNSLSSGLGTNWTTVPGSSSTDSITITPNAANGSVFYRLTYP